MNGEEDTKTADFLSTVEEYSEPRGTSKMKLFAKIVKDC